MQMLFVRTDVHHHRCTECGQQLHLGDMVDMSPRNYRPTPEDPRPPRYVRLWVRCRDCCRTNVLRFPIDARQPLDVPKELVSRLVSCAKAPEVTKAKSLGARLLTALSQFWTDLRFLAVVLASRKGGRHE